MKHITSVNEFFDFLKKKHLTVNLDEKGWVKLSEKEPIQDILQSAISYRIDENGERHAFLRNQNIPLWFKYKIVRSNKIVKTGFLTMKDNEWSDLNTREKVDNQLDRMGEIYWYDFSSYKTEMEKLMEDNGYIVGQPVELLKMGKNLPKTSSLYKNDIGKSFIVKNIAINVDKNKDIITGGVFIPVSIGYWVSTDNVKSLE